MALPVPHRNEPVASYDERTKTVAVNDNWHRFFEQIAATFTGLLGAGSPSGALGTAAYGNIASVAEVRSAATGNKVMVAEHLETAAASVDLEDAATVAIDWKSGISFDLTVAGDRVIGNPTNGIPRTHRTIIVQGDDGTERTLTFGTQYGGELPEVEDMTSTKWYEITIHCISATHFRASAVDCSPP